MAKLSIWNNKYSDVYDFTPSQSGKPNFELKISEIEEEQEPIVDLYNFEKIVNKFEARNEKKLDNINDLDAIFGDDSFYKEDEQNEESYSMDNFYKMPIQYGNRVAPNSANMKSFYALFWYKNYEEMMSSKGIEIPLAFYYGIKELSLEGVIMQKSRSTILTDEQIDELVQASRLPKSSLPQLAIMEIKIEKSLYSEQESDIK